MWHDESVREQGLEVAPHKAAWFTSEVNRAEIPAVVAIGEVVGGKYVIGPRLGHGAMGVVFRARHEQLGRDVAIKVLHAGALASPVAIARFEREARAAASLQSEHVARVLDIGRLASGVPFIVMELLDGRDLAAILRDLGRLPVDEAVDAILQACDAMAEAHARGIVHRDLKPANLFVATRANGTRIVKVVDFGISKAQGSLPSLALTSSVAFMGSPLYMSPEQLNDSRGVDPRADVWALGVTLYELLAGRPPFVAEGFAELCARIITEEPISLCTLRPDAVTPSVDRVVARCLRKDPAQRITDGEELRAALRAVNAGVAPYAVSSASDGRRSEARSPASGASPLRSAWWAHEVGSHSTRPVEAPPSSSMTRANGSPALRRALVLGVALTVVIGVASMAAWPGRARSVAGVVTQATAGTRPIEEIRVSPVSAAQPLSSATVMEPVILSALPSADPSLPPAPPGSARKVPAAAPRASTPPPNAGGPGLPHPLRNPYTAPP